MLLDIWRLVMNIHTDAPGHHVIQNVVNDLSTFNKMVPHTIFFALGLHHAFVKKLWDQRSSAHQPTEQRADIKRWTF